MLMAQIKLTQNKVAIVDDANFEWLNQWKWQYDLGYARRSVNMGKFENGKQHITHISMHRLIMDEPENMEIDHKNGDGLDNRRSNLRICTRAQNQQNRKIHKNKEFKGVNWHKRVGRWAVAIRVNKKLIHIGYYSDRHVAAKAYDEAAKKHFGEFARTNNV